MRDLAIRNTHPTVVTINGEAEAWDATGNVVALDETLITAEINRLQAEHDQNQYQRDRAQEYPPMTDYLDGVVKNDQAQIDKYIADCQAVKTRYPKP
jgi:hypothetical protein